MAGLAAFGGTCDADEFLDDDAEPDDRDHQPSQADPVSCPYRRWLISPDH